jgi:undecaprenyl diphosphate synthase
MKAVREAIGGAVESGIRVLTLFAFSTENWQRPPREIRALMALLKTYAEREQEELREKGVEVRVLGEIGRLDKPTRSAVQRIMEVTEGGNALRVNLMISYSGRGEILQAARRIAESVRDGDLDPGDIDQGLFERFLFTRGLPDPDLLIRTSGESRISNFLLWQLAYTELHISPVLWPDFTRESLFSAVVDFQTRERRFGRVPAP